MILKNSYESATDILIILDISGYEKLFLKVTFIYLNCEGTVGPKHSRNWKMSIGITLEFHISTPTIIYQKLQYCYVSSDFCIIDETN